MAGFTETEWRAVMEVVDRRGADFGLPSRRSDSIVLASFNIRKLGKVANKSAGAWEFLRYVCDRCDLISIQEVQDDLEGLNHLKDLLGSSYGMVASDITGGIAGKRAMVERLAFLFRWRRVSRTEVASDITIDRSAVLDNLYSDRFTFWEDLENRSSSLAAWDARRKLGKRPKKPPFVLRNFLTFIRTPLCVSFRVPARGDGVPYEFLAVNAHLLYGDKSTQKQEREMEFRTLLAWLIERGRQASRMYHKNLILLGDLNLDFTEADPRRDEIEEAIKSLNGGALRGRGRATVNFPFIDVHPDRAEVFRSSARLTETYDQIAFFNHDDRLPDPDANDTAGSSAAGFDYGVFNFSDLFAEVLHDRPMDELTSTTRKALIRRFEHDVSDHMPIWIRLPLP